MPITFAYPPKFLTLSQALEYDLSVPNLQSLISNPGGYLGSVSNDLFVSLLVLFTNLSGRGALAGLADLWAMSAALLTLLAE